MPRNVKESDDEVETKGARRTRAALNSTALDSPLRRSTRIKPPANQELSSPESVSDVGSVSAPKNTRRRTTTGETGIPEAARITRGRRNSAASDISELTETESLPDGPPKRITRRSVTGTSLADTPTMLNSRTRRATRAGSETKSTSPVGRPVRRTRASSMEPETIDETKNRQVGTPVKSRRRASHMPSEPAVAEESEDGRSADVAKKVEATVYETNEDEFETSTHNTSASLRQKPEIDRNESDEKMEVDESPESPASGTNAEEATGSIEEQSNDKSLPNGGSPAPISEKIVEDVEPESLKKKNEAEQKVAASDDDSEYSGYPAFKDIPADEWLGGDAEGTKKQTSDETNSVHSASTERNESECEIELVDKEALPSGEKYEYKREEKFDYDTDDTVITQVVSATRETEDKRSEEKAVVDEVTPMDVSSDEDGDVASKSSRESPKKRLSLATPRKSIGSNTSLKKKNDSIACSIDVESTITESPTKDDANVSVKSNRSSSKSPKKRSSLSAGRPKDDDSSDSDENSEAKSTQAGRTANRKSLEASAKKLNVSAKNTPSKTESGANGSPAKRRSSNKFTRICNYDNSDDELDDAEDKNKSQSSSESGPTQSGVDEGETFAKAAPKFTPMKQGKSRLSGINASDGNSSITLTEDTQSSPPMTEEQEDRSVKTGSARKSMSNRSTSKITDSNSDSEIGDEDSSAKTDEKTGSARKSMSNRSTSKITDSNSDSEIEDEDSLAKTDDKSSTPESARANKNDSQAAQDSSDSDIEGDNAKDEPASPKIDGENLNVSAKLGSARKSAIHEQNLNGSAKQGSARKSAIHEQNLNGSAKQGSARKSAIHEQNLNGSAKQGSARKSATHEESLNRSSKQGSARKSAIERNNSKIAPVGSDSEAEFDDANKSPKSSEDTSRASRSSLIDTDSEPDEAETQPKVAKSKIGSAKKLLIDVDRNHSTIAQVNSDSEVIESSSSDEDASSMIPQFFFDQDSMSSSSNSSIENDDSSDTIDSDVARDLNLHGRSVLEYSDDDVPADDCMATESESSDSDDDGADLLDFVVDDDEEYDSFEDVAMELGADENDDSSDSEKKKTRRRIISRPGGDSDSNESDEEKAREAIESDNGESTAKTPKRDKKPNKLDVAEPEVQSGDLDPSSRAAAKRNRNIFLQSSTPRVPIDERLSFDKADSPKGATPLGKSLKNADSSAKVETSQTPLAKKLSKSVCETEETPSKLGSSFKVAKAATPLSESLKNADSSTPVETSQTSSAKKLSKSVCETEETPTKLGSSFKVAKTPKTPGTAAQQLRTSLPTDFTASVRETNLSKTKSTKLSGLNRTMTTPNIESPETRFLMKEKLNESLPALKLQHRAKALRRSTLDNLREIPSTDEQLEDAAEEGANVDAQAATLEPEVDNTEKKNRKKKKAAKNTSLELDSKSLGMSMEAESMSIDNGTFECPSFDAPRDVSKKRDKKKKKLAEMESEEPVESKNERVPTKDKKKNKELEESIEDVQVSEPNKKDKKKRKKLDGTVDDAESIEISKKSKKKKRAENVDEFETIEISKKDKNKKKRPETVDEVENVEVTKKDKNKKKREETVDEVESVEVTKKYKNKKKLAETVDEVESVEISKKDKKKKKRAEIVDEVETIEISEKDKKKKKRAEAVDEVVAEVVKKNKSRNYETTVEAAEAPTKKKKLLRGAEKNDAGDSSNDLDNLPEAVQDGKSKRQQRKIQTRSTGSNGVETSRTTLKRLPDEVLESLAETAERPTKRRKISKSEKILPSRTMFDGSHRSTATIKIDDGFIPLSVSGGTTEFAVVNLQKATKKSKRSVAAGSFRERMLARNTREPVSAYLMFQQKQKASGKDRPY